MEALDAQLPCIEKGSLTSFFKFCVSDTGRIIQIESPEGVPHFTAIPPNYAICHSSDVSTSLTYNFGGFNSGASKTMKFQIRRG